MGSNQNHIIKGGIWGAVGALSFSDGIRLGLQGAIVGSGIGLIVGKVAERKFREYALLGALGTCVTPMFAGLIAGAISERRFRGDLFMEGIGNRVTSMMAGSIAGVVAAALVTGLTQKVCSAALAVGLFNVALIFPFALASLVKIYIRVPPPG